MRDFIGNIGDKVARFTAFKLIPSAILAGIIVTNMEVGGLLDSPRQNEARRIAERRDDLTTKTVAAVDTTMSWDAPWQPKYNIRVEFTDGAEASLKYHPNIILNFVHGKPLEVKEGYEVKVAPTRKEDTYKILEVESNS